MKNKVVFKITGLDCSACVITVDGVLEEADGVHEVKTNYAKQTTAVTFDPQKISSQHLLQIIKQEGYEAILSES